MCVCVCVCVGVCRLGIDMLMDNRKILISIEERRAQTASFLLSSRDRWPRHRPGGVLKKKRQKNRATGRHPRWKAGGPAASGIRLRLRRVNSSHDGESVRRLVTITRRCQTPISVRRLPTEPARVS